MKAIKIVPDGRFIKHYRTEQDIEVRVGGRKVLLLVGDAVLLHRRRLLLFGVHIYSWFVFVRTVPVHEWAQAALGPIELPDEMP